MATGTTIAGKGELMLDGQPYNCQEIAVSPSTSTAEKMVGMGGVAGDKETPRAPSFTCKIIVTADVNVTVLCNLRNVDGAIEMADGRVYHVIGASCSKAPEHGATDGTLDLEFQCFSIVEGAA